MASINGVTTQLDQNQHYEPYFVIIVRQFLITVPHLFQTSDTTIEIDVVRAYLTEDELTAAFNPRYDKRRRAHVHGRAMHLKYAEALHGGNFSQAEGTFYSAHRYGTYGDWYVQ